MTKQEALDLLEELRVARDADHISEWEVRERAAAILDRGPLKPLDLVEYLQQQGFLPVRIAREIARFGAAVKAAYRAEYGSDPLKRHILIRGEQVAVMAYVEDDRDLIDDAFADLYEMQVA